jgi:preprotein translocase subunit SecG
MPRFWFGCATLFIVALILMGCSWRYTDKPPKYKGYVLVETGNAG